MKNIFKILTLLLCYNTFAQQKTIEYQDEFGQKCDAKISFFRLTKTIINDSTMATELYDNKEKEIINIKNFKNNIKNGKFTYYKKGKISNEINFKNDLLIGDLKIYNKKGKLERTINYDKANEFLNQDSFRQDEGYYNENSLDEIEKPVFISEKTETFQDYLQKSLYLNEQQIETGESYKEYCEVFINKNGTIDDIVFIRAKQINNFHLEILRILLNDLKWKPATKNGLTINCRIVLPIVFIVNDEEY